MLFILLYQQKICAYHNVKKISVDLLTKNVLDSDKSFGNSASLQWCNKHQWNCFELKQLSWKVVLKKRQTWDRLSSAISVSKTTFFRSKWKAAFSETILASSMLCCPMTTKKITSSLLCPKYNTLIPTKVC